MYAQAALKPNPLLRNCAYGIVMRGVQKMNTGVHRYAGIKNAPLCCINLDTATELLISIISSIAQEESRSISENVTWGQRKRFADGKVSFAYSRVLGLDKGADGQIVVNEEQAETVRLIFKLFLEGMSPYAIAKELTARGIKTSTGKDKWNQGTIRRMLLQEKWTYVNTLDKKS